MAISKDPVKPSDTLIHKTTNLMQNGLNSHAFGEYGSPNALGDARWTDELILATWYMAETGKVPDDLNYKTGKSGGGFDRLDFKFLYPWLIQVDTHIEALLTNHHIGRWTLYLLNTFS